jgi:hypothetical protein
LLCQVGDRSFLRFPFNLLRGFLCASLVVAVTLREGHFKNCMSPFWERGKGKYKRKKHINTALTSAKHV